MLLLREEAEHQVRYRCLMTDEPEKLRAAVAAHNQDAGQPAIPPATSSSDLAAVFTEIAHKTGLTPLDLSRPLPLSPVFIPKPWGQEIWYSGIESRGVSRMLDVPISWVLDVFGEWLTGLEPGASNRPPILLKILDPHPTENFGDLYFEMHQEKIEVYVVTGIDAGAWPDGAGQIRVGFDPDRLQQYSSQAAFLNDYLKAVEAYQAVRAKIDPLLDVRRAQAGHGANEAVSPALLAAWHEQLPQPLIAEECRLREAMYAFTAVRPLAIGDVVRVQPFMPHALQHGVRVVEFQTPHYERYILSFGQKVLTQTHWDTREALNKVILSDEPDKPQAPTPPDLDLIADFESFRVLRINLAAGEAQTLNDQDDLTRRTNGYALAMGIFGQADVGRVATTPSEDCPSAAKPAMTRLAGEAAVYIPAGASPIQFTNPGSEPACVLVAWAE